MQKAIRKLSVLFLLSVFVISGAFAGGNTDKEVSADEPIELVYWSHYGQSPAFVEAFADSVELAAKNLGYDNVTCRAEIVEMSGYETKYITAFTSGTGPDFFVGHPSDWALDGGKPMFADFNDPTLAKFLLEYDAKFNPERQ